MTTREMVVSMEGFVAAPPFTIRKKQIGMSVRKLCLRANTTYALISASGRGKSVFLSMLSGYFPSAWRGHVKWSEFSVFQNFVVSPRDRKKLSLPVYDVGEGNALIYLPQNFPLDRAEVVSTLEAMAFVLCAGDRSISFRQAKRQIYNFVLDPSFNLDPAILEQPIQQLSGGERRRVELLTRLEAVCPNDKSGGICGARQALILLDEPTTGFDILNETRFIQFLGELHALAKLRGLALTILVATHAFGHLSAGGSYFDEVLILDRDDEPAACKKASTIRLVFQGTILAAHQHFSNIRMKPTAITTWSDIISVLETTSSLSLENLYFDQ